jgi:hypothetical protein
MLVLLALGGVVVFPKPSPDLFPALCSGNFRLENTNANTGIVPTPESHRAPDGELIGLSEGAQAFDLRRANNDEVQYKREAAEATTNDPDKVTFSLDNAIHSDRADAEAQIYRENWKVLNSGHPHLTFVVGVGFPSSSASSSSIKEASVDYAESSRDTLQGAFSAQKECNDRNQQDGKTQIVLMIANIGESVYGNNIDENAKFVADQIANQAKQDKTIVGIIGWSFSADSVTMNHELKIKGSTLPMVSPTSAADELGGRYNFFRMGQKNRKFAQIAADFLLRIKKKKRIAIIYAQDNTYAENLKNDMKTDVPGTNIVGSPNDYSYTGGNPKTVQAALTKVLAEKPDTIFFSGYEGDLFNLLDDLAGLSHISDKKNLIIVSAPALSTTNDYRNYHLPEI